MVAPLLLIWLAVKDWRHVENEKEQNACGCEALIAGKCVEMTNNGQKSTKPLQQASSPRLTRLTHFSGLAFVRLLIQISLTKNESSHGGRRGPWV